MTKKKRRPQAPKRGKAFREGHRGIGGKSGSQPLSPPTDDDRAKGLDWEERTLFEDGYQT